MSSESFLEMTSYMSHILKHAMDNPIEEFSKIFTHIEYYEEEKGDAWEPNMKDTINE